MTEGTLSRAAAVQLAPSVDNRTDITTRMAYASDASHYLLIPKSVVIARSVADVAEVFRTARREQIPVTLRSGGTSLAGQAAGEGIIVDVRKHFRDITVLDEGRRVRVQPGATVRHVNNRLSLYGYKLGPDPASEAACTIGGVISNNSSGMACGTEFNTYNTLESMVFVLPSGTVIDTSDSQADEVLRLKEPQLYRTLIQLRDRVRSNERSREIIAKHFALKNTMGYGVNSFIDFELPVEILSHLIIGAEGTLAFVAEATFRTRPIARLATTTVAVFDDLDSATRLLPELIATGAMTLELMDSTSIRVGQGFAAVPPAIQGFEPESQAALLVEYHADSTAELAELQSLGQQILDEARLFAPAAFSTDSQQAALAWNFRKGLYAQVASARPTGTTALLEDVAVPVAQLADTCAALQQSFDRFGYEDAVIFGHAKDGNIHFLLTDRFVGDDALSRYDSFNEEMVDIVLSAGGNLKAEHGTGRAMAPYVRRQYGDELYEVMVALKQACDPRQVMNPGVIIDSDPQAHIANIKLTPAVDDQIDSCVECGYCEPVCPSRDLTLTPRQRIVLQRARTRLAEAGQHEAVAEIDQEYRYRGEATCAVDSLCRVACPLGIDTGVYIKSRRAQHHSGVEKSAWKFAASQWSAVTTGASAVLSGVHYLPQPLVDAAARAARAVAGAERVPRYTPELPAGGRRRANLGSVIGAAGEPVAVYFPACVHTMFGSATGTATVDALVQLVTAAGVGLRIPEQIDSLCCSTPWVSKGYQHGAQVMAQRLRQQLLAATDDGALPVVVDASSCSEGLRGALAESGVEVIDATTFVAKTVLPRLQERELLAGVDMGTVIIHPTCSSVHLNLGDDIRALAAAVSQDVVVPQAWGCCAYAGDRGMLHPELTASATAPEAAEVAAVIADRTHSGGQPAQIHLVSSNRTCELGMTAATGRPYRHILEVLAQGLKGAQRS